MINIENIIRQNEYDFLRNNNDLKNTIYLVLSGSYGYGTNNENSDTDLRGVLVEDKKYLFGLNSFEQFEKSDTDTVIYGLKKYIKLCAEANPNTLELLGIDEDCIVVMDKGGQILRDNKELFLSKRVIGSFGNYATAQLKRLQNALCHDSYTEQKKTLHLKNTLNSQMEHFKSTYTTFDKGSIIIYTDEKSKKLVFDIDIKKYPISEFIGIYSEINNIIRTYNKLNHRNNKKDNIHLYKHAMHLLRLLITGTDILNGKGIITKRIEENDFLINIRNGKYSFEEIFEFTDKYQIEFEKSAKTSNLPDKPDLNKIEDLIMHIYSLYVT